MDVATIIQYPARDDEGDNVVVDDKGEDAVAVAVVADAGNAVVVLVVGTLLLLLPVHLTSAKAWKVAADNSGVDDNSTSV